MRTVGPAARFPTRTAFPHRLPFLIQSTLCVPTTSRRFFTPRRISKLARPSSRLNPSEQSLRDPFPQELPSDPPHPPPGMGLLDLPNPPANGFGRREGMRGFGGTGLVRQGVPPPARKGLHPVDHGPDPAPNPLSNGSIGPPLFSQFAIRPFALDPHQPLAWRWASPELAPSSLHLLRGIAHL